MINQNQTQIIQNFLKEAQITDQDLMDDLLDHMSCDIEWQIKQGLSFEEAWPISREKILPKEPVQVQKDLEFLTTKTQNIMIKKIAFIGGYLSALCICLAILFGATSYQEDLRSDGIKERVQAQMIPEEFKPMTPEQRSDFFGRLWEEAIKLKISSLTYLELSQSLLIVAISLFSISYLPYRFYNSYRKSQLEFST